MLSDDLSEENRCWSWQWWECVCVDRELKKRGRCCRDGGIVS